MTYMRHPDCVIPPAVTRHAASANVLATERQAPGIMKTQPHPSDREVLAGLVERVTYQNAENGFCVIRVKARSHRDTSPMRLPVIVLPPRIANGSRPLWDH